jgi:signal transduction histidine kinase
VFLGNPNDTLTPLQRFGIYLTIAVAALNCTPLVFSSLGPAVNATPKPAAGAGLFLLHLIIFLGLSLVVLVRQIKYARGAQRLQYFYLILGIAPIFLFAPITGFAMPIILHNTALVMLTPLYGTFFVCVIGYAIVRHKLFDIHFFVVRALAYLSTMFVITLLLITPMVLLFSYILHVQLSAGRLVSIIVLSACALYILQYMRNVFDRVTSKIFFRHYYDPQEVLDKLSNILVRTADVTTLRVETAQVLKDALEPSLIKYILFTDENDAELAAKITKHSHVATSNVIDADDIDTGDERLLTLLKDNGIIVAVKLRTTHEDLGYMILGHKQSGAIYTERDKRLLSVAADEIAISLQNALRFQEIQNFNETLQKKIEDATRRLRESNRKLKMLDETKDDFISMASHQLRTPLTSVKGYLSLVLDGDAGTIMPTQRKLLTQAFISSQRMVYLIADLLNVSRLKTGKFIIESSAINLADVVQEEVAQLVETAQSRSLTLTYHKPAHFLNLMLDETKIRQVVMNFMDNAIYYTPAGGHIDVQVIDTPKSIEFRVVDDGIGVPKDEQHHLFTKFYRAKNAQRARPDGTGLGLFMAQKVVVAQGGAVIFSSKEGKGSTFGFTFPKEKLLAPEPAAANAASVA